MESGIGPTEIFAMSTGLLIGAVIAAIPLIFFCLTLQKCLNRCAPPNRTLNPPMVWLLFVPLFNIIWQFFVVLRISSSLANEFRARNMEREAEPGKMLGLAFCILYVCGIIPLLGIFASIAGFVCWIIYWVKIAGYSSEIASPAPVPVDQVSV